MSISQTMVQLSCSVKSLLSDYLRISMACIINKLRSHPKGTLVCRKMESRQLKQTNKKYLEDVGR